MYCGSTLNDVSLTFLEHPFSLVLGMREVFMFEYCYEKIINLLSPSLKTALITLKNMKIIFQHTDKHNVKVEESIEEIEIPRFGSV